MRFSSSGGIPSPRQSVPWSMPHSSPVCGCQPHPIVLRRPRAYTLRSLPSTRMRLNVAAMQEPGVWRFLEQQLGGELGK